MFRPAPPDPSTGWIKLHHNGPSSARPDAFVNQIVEQVDGGGLFNDGLWRREDHRQCRGRSTSKTMTTMLVYGLPPLYPLMLIDE
jgi:hypothetical protein